MQFRNRRRSDGRPAAIFVVIGAAVLGIAAAWWLTRDGEEDVAEFSLPAGPVVVDSGPVPADSIEALDLPPLDSSDAEVRNLVSTLSAHPRLASWLVTDDLVTHFVGTVVDLAGGNSPAEHLEFLRPEGAFSTRTSGAAVIIDDASFQRYDPFIDTFVSLDTDGTARLYYQLLPLFDEAFAELGIPEWTFRDTFTRAVDNLLAVPVPSGPVRLEEDRSVYRLEDTGLEESSAAAKHLLRMGPENQRRLQAKLRALKDRIDELGGDAQP